MIDFVVVSSDLQPHISYTRVVSWITLEEEKAGQSWQAQACSEGLLGTFRDVFNLWESIFWIPGVRVDHVLPHLSSMRLPVAVAISSAVPVADSIPEPGGGHWQ
ncbi:hypothetical protein ATANTOWER_027226 [Ataeniobius toweri]|uniref:Uncharacterized protein n=1 Tax=Ataeniobius toweri TaxID=208326 RepID=A0ABU7A0R3_9TELE|nr:hypothetical protein [Ataeniobius toweri]